MSGVLNIFDGKAFRIIELTDLVNNQDYKPGLIGASGLFNERGVKTTMVMIDETRGGYNLIPYTKRGAPATKNKSGLARSRPFLIPHIALEDEITADEVQDARVVGTANAMKSAQTEIRDRLVDMRDDLEVTKEYHLLGAIKGQILDADGSVALDLYQEFQQAAPAPVVFNLPSASGGDFREATHETYRMVQDAVGNDIFSHLHAWCAPDFYDAVLKNTEVREAMDRPNDSFFKRDNKVYGVFEFGAITFQEYRGAVNGNQMIDPGECRIVPMGTDLFHTYYAPADFEETVNTKGVPYYASQERGKHGRSRDLHLQTNPLHLCHKPQALITGQIGV